MMMKTLRVLLASGTVAASLVAAPGPASAAGPCATNKTCIPSNSVFLHTNNQVGSAIGTKICATNAALPSSSLTLSHSKTTTVTATGGLSVSATIGLFNIGASGQLGRSIGTTETISQTIAFPALARGQCAQAFELVDVWNYTLQIYSCPAGAAFRGGCLKPFEWTSSQVGLESHLDALTVRLVAP